MKVEYRDLFEYSLYISSILGILVHLVVISGWPVIAPLIALSVVSLASSFLCLHAIPGTAQLLLDAGLAGRDCHKKQRPLVAEAMGVAVGFTYAIGLTIFVPFVFLYRKEVGLHELKELSMFLSALLSINSMCFLGFADNVLNLRWRHKLTLPTIASLPVLFVYYIQGGSTHVLVPDLIRKFFFPREPTLAVDFGFFYYAFLAMLSVFGTNAINILAGVNGIEVGQSIILSLAMVANVVIQMNRHPWDSWQFNDETVFSLYILLPFLCCSISLWIFNKYPSRVFVGDTYCYLAGTALAVAGILGHCSKTLLLFMVPQVINFIYSLPQLFRLIPCPRHRMPVYVEELDQVGVSYTDWIDEKTLNRTLVSVIHTFGIARIERKERNLIRFSNFTVINFLLWKVAKPVNEGTLVNVLLGIQLAWIMLAFLLRYKAAGFFYTLVD